MEMLGWIIYTVAMTVPVMQEKVTQLRVLLTEWPADRRGASGTEVWSLLGKLLYLCEAVRPGKFCVRRILNQLGLAPLKAGEGNGFGVGRKQRRGYIDLGREFRDNLAFWTM